MASATLEKGCGGWRGRWIIHFNLLTAIKRRQQSVFLTQGKKRCHWKTKREKGGSTWKRKQRSRWAVPFSVSIDRQVKKPPFVVSTRARRPLPTMTQIRPPNISPPLSVDPHTHTTTLISSLNYSDSIFFTSVFAEGGNGFCFFLEFTVKATHEWVCESYVHTPRFNNVNHALNWIREKYAFCIFLEAFRRWLIEISGNRIYSLL